MYTMYSVVSLWLPTALVITGAKPQLIAGKDTRLLIVVYQNFNQISFYYLARMGYYFNKNTQENKMLEICEVLDLSKANIMQILKQMFNNNVYINV